MATKADTFKIAWQTLVVILVAGVGMGLTVVWEVRCTRWDHRDCVQQGNKATKLVDRIDSHVSVRMV